MSYKKYTPQKVESKWQKRWAESKLYQAKDNSDLKKFYCLIEFPYPSGAGLHVGHVRSWSAMDAYSRKKRMEGYNVLFPIGWDAFGLPAENYAIKTKTHPSDVVPKNIENYKNQIKSLGLSFDWSREINTTDPNYYKWTQWIFVQLFKNNMAYQAEVPVNWCPKCKTNLADEEVLENGTHERCGNQTEKRLQKQWLLKITKYADRLIEDLKEVDYPERVSIQQINWIGRSEGIEINFKFEDTNKTVKVFTTRPDTLYGTTFLVISPNSPNALKMAVNSKKDEVAQYIKKSCKNHSTEKDKTGVFTGRYVINPANNKRIPVWISDYVVASYGSEAVMGVSGHDQRDWDFAKKYNLEIIEVVEGGDVSKDPYDKEGKIVNSGSWNGLEYPKDSNEIVSDIVKKGWGKKKISYRIHDWIFSRQHYWGEPIPIIHCPKCGAVSVPEEDLPVKLPFLKNYQPSGTGESPLAKVDEWVNTICPKCGSKAKRETDTMPNWAGSNWYFIRYLDPKNNKEMANKESMKYWLPVDLYQGGYEHTTLHLLYSRFIYKFLYDIGIVPTKEPYARRRVHGIVLGSDGTKMSKSVGNVISPDDIVKKYGADSLRLYEMFMGPFDQTNAWSDESLEGCYRFLGRLWTLFNKNVGEKTQKDLLVKLHQTINKVSKDIEDMKFNTVVSCLMEFSNFWKEKGTLSKSDAERLVRLLAPFAPHISEEIWTNVLGNKFSVHCTSWPKFDKSLTRQEEVKVIIQVNGKLRGFISIKNEDINDKDKLINMVKMHSNIKKWINDSQIKDTVFVPGKVLNFITK